MCSFVTTKAAWSIATVQFSATLQFDCLSQRILHSTYIAIPKSSNLLGTCQNWSLTSLIVWEDGVGRKVSGIVPSIPQQLPNGIKSMEPGFHVRSWKPSLWPIIKDQTPLPCHVKGLLKKLIQAWNMLDYWKYCIIYLFHILDMLGVCCK